MSFHDLGIKSIITIYCSVAARLFGTLSQSMVLLPCKKNLLFRLYTTSQIVILTNWQVYIVIYRTPETKEFTSQLQFTCLWSCLSSNLYSLLLRFAHLNREKSICSLDIDYVFSTYLVCRSMMIKWLESIDYFCFIVNECYILTQPMFVWYFTWVWYLYI